MKKIIYFIVISVITFNTAFSQRIIKKSYQVKPNANIKLNIQFSDKVKINTWNKNTVNVEFSVNINDNKNNDKFMLEEKNLGNSLIINSKIKDLDKLSKHKVIISGDDTIINCNTKLNINVTVTVPESSNFIFKTINGDIEVIGCSKGMDINTISGFVDMSLAGTSKVDLEMSTISGSVYTDMKIDLKNAKENMKQIVGETVEGSLNGGGSDIELNSISGDIYLRKKK